MSWIVARNGQVPHGAVCAGRDNSGGPIFVARAHHNGDIIPGKLVQSTNSPVGKAYGFKMSRNRDFRHNQPMPGNTAFGWVGNVNPVNGMYLSWDGAEHYKNDYEVLCHLDVDWREMRPGQQIPQFAYPAGKTASGEVLYVGRAQHGNSLQVGKVHFSHSCCYIPYEGQEISHQNYEIMIIKSI